MPSGADIATVSAPRVGLPVLDLAAARTRPAFPDGQRFVAARLAEIQTLTRLGMPVTVVFDLDNTVFDTRHRTLHAARAFDAQQGTTHFAGASVGDMAVDGRLTAQKLGLPDDVIETFSAFWDASFWTPAHLAHDAPIADMVELVHRARSAGATVRFLTGRTQDFHGDSVAQLRRAGVDVDGADVCCKPDLTVRTAPFKEQVLKAWQRSAEIGFFVTEGVRDLQHAHSTVTGVPLVRLGCSFEDASLAEGVARASLSTIPVWPAAF